MIKRAALIAVMSLIPLQSHAGAWVHREGGGQAIFTARYQTESPSKLELNPMVEYGLSRRFTVGANLGYRAIDRESGKKSLGYAEAFGRYQLASGSAGVLSAQLMAGSAARGLSARADDASAVWEARLLAGRSFALSGEQSLYVNAETAFRSFLGKVGNESRSELTLGWKFAPAWIFLVQGFYTDNLRKDPTVYDYDSAQGQVSLVAPVAPGWNVQAGWNKTVGGRNVRFDSNVFGAFWFSW